MQTTQQNPITAKSEQSQKRALNSELKKGQLGDPEFEVRQFMKNYAEAVRGGNMEEILSYYSDDIEAFECPPPLAFHGISEYSQNWKSHFASEFNFPVTYEFVGEKILASPELATFSSLLHIRGTSKKNGEEIESWLRLTCVLEKSKGYWQIAHDHMSVPVSEEGRALMNLGPDDAHTH